MRGRWPIGVVLAVVVLAAAAKLGAGGRSSPNLFEPPVLGGQPAGAVVLSQKDHDLAVGLALKPQAGKTLVVATVLAPDGRGAGGLRLRFGSGGSSAKAEAGPSGTYAAVLPLRRPGRTVHVSLERPGRRTDEVAFRVPSLWPPRSGRRELAEATRTYRRLHTLVIHERLATAPGVALTSVYRAVAPHSLSITSSNGDRSIVIGARRWDRHPGAGWTESEQQPPLDPLAPFWHGLTEDPTVLGHAVVNGHRVVRLSFAAPQIPAFFELTVDEASHVPLELEMIAAAHFMHHAYSDFDAPARIEPPGRQSGRRVPA
jgi:hypothetical protein